MVDFIFEAIGELFEGIVNFVTTIINGVLSLIDHVVNYFKGLKLRKGKDIPFIADEKKIADLIHHAPEKHVGIFEATYNEDTNEIQNYRGIEADELDSDLKSILGNEKLVVLS